MICSKDAREEALKELGIYLKRGQKIYYSGKKKQHISKI
jgi:hypothetical protein